ncbi:hypothetical protein D3C72_257720 [compost metagenome]|jgi:hypothetical protein
MMDKGFTVEVVTEVLGGGHRTEYFLVIADSVASAEQIVWSALGEVESVSAKATWDPHDHFMRAGVRMMSVGSW